MPLLVQGNRQGIFPVIVLLDQPGYKASHLQLGADKLNSGLVHSEGGFFAVN